MAYHVPYSGKTIYPVPDAGEEIRVAFDIVPAWGSDVARIKSIVYASTALIHDGQWSPETQRAVAAAFEDGAELFINTVTGIRGLTIPAEMALRAGLIVELPNRVGEGGVSQPDPGAPFAITKGSQFARVCGALLAIALSVALEIGKLQAEAEQRLDPRFFGRPSGSGEPAPVEKAKTSTAGTVRSKRRRLVTAAEK